TYIHQKAKAIRYEGKAVNKTPRGKLNSIIKIELKLDNVAVGNGQDKIYVFTDRTYRKKKYTL
ncbi:MAG: hypothetical protein ACFFDN_46215, partial [Candidatus Hodarchaeota archaeon]